MTKAERKAFRKSLPPEIKETIRLLKRNSQFPKSVKGRKIAGMKG